MIDRDTSGVTSEGESNIASIYDRYWATGGFQPPSNRNTFLDDSIAKFCHAGKSVADLGCGDARTVGDRAHRAGAAYTGIDVSQSAVAAASARGLDVRRVEDIATTGLDADAFDAVFIIEVLEHLLDPVSAVVEAQRLLKPGGSLLVTVPNAAVWPRRVELLLKGRPNGMGDDLSRSEPWRDPHIRSFTVGSLGALLSSCGFHQVRVGGTEPVPSVAGERAVTLRPQLFARRITAVATV